MSTGTSTLDEIKHSVSFFNKTTLYLMHCVSVYPGKYEIYLLTTEEHKKKGIYIIGKATKLKGRLSPYNKTAEHEVIYHKECKNKSLMKTIETMILEKLDKYREKANRDRFILPIENDISLFTNEIDKAIAYFN